MVWVIGLLGISIAGRGLLQRVADNERYQTALQESDKRLRTITGTVMDAILMMDANGRISFYNLAAEHIFGWTAEEAVGKDLHRLLAPNQYHEAYERHIEHFRQSGEGPAIGMTRELTALHKNGAEFPVELSLSAAKVGDAWHGVGVIRDITERKQMEETLQESEELHRVMFSSSRDAIMTLNPPSWKFTSCNPVSVAMFGAKDESEFILHDPWELSPERQPDGQPSSEKAKKMIETAMQDGSHFFEWRHKRLGGEEFPATVLLARLEIGDHAFLQATVRDISHQKQMVRRPRFSWTQN